MRFSDYKDFDDFLNKTGMHPDDAILFLDEEIDKMNRIRYKKT